MRAQGDAVCKRVLLASIVVAAFAMGFPGTAVAQDVRATVRIDGRPVIRVGGTADITAQERADRIESRLLLLLDNPSAITPSRVEIAGPAETERAITVAGVTVATVTETDAEENLVPIDVLATQWAASIDQELARARDARVTTLGRFTAEVVGSVRTAFARLAESTIVVVPRLLAALLVIGLFWIIATALRAVLTFIVGRLFRDPTAENLVRQVAYYSVWVIGVFVAADALGFDPATVAAGLGLGTLVLGFALKDVLSNFVSGLLILLTRPFRINDQIVIGEIEGTVERILLRATQLRTYDGRQVLVPNAEVFTSRVTNNTASTVRRASVVVHVGYDTDLQEAATACHVAADTVADVLSEPPPSVQVNELGQEGITLELRFWADSRRSDFVATRAEVRRAVVEALREAGIALPQPDQLTVRLSS